MHLKKVALIHIKKNKKRKGKVIVLVIFLLFLRETP